MLNIRKRKINLISTNHCCFVYEGSPHSPPGWLVSSIKTQAAQNFQLSYRTEHLLARSGSSYLSQQDWELLEGRSGFVSYSYSHTWDWRLVTTQMWGGKHFLFSTIPFKHLSLIKMNAVHKGLTDQRAGILSCDCHRNNLLPPLLSILEYTVLLVFPFNLKPRLASCCRNIATSKRLIPML